jgi:hypothetical protein
MDLSSVVDSALPSVEQASCSPLPDHRRSIEFQKILKTGKSGFGLNSAKGGHSSLSN